MMEFVPHVLFYFDIAYPAIETRVRNSTHLHQKADSSSRQLIHHEAFAYSKATALCTARSRFCSPSLLPNLARKILPYNICLRHNYKP